MAMYEYITDEGYNLMRRMLTEGCTVDFTRIEMGNGEPPESNLRKVTALSNAVVSLNVDSVDVQDDNTISISSIFTNEGLDRGFYFREKGIYATDGQKEILFSYANAGPSANYIDPPSVEVIEKKIITHITQMQESTEKINVKVKSGIYVTTDVFQNFQSQNIKDLDKKADKLTEFSTAEQRENIQSGDTIDVILGKIQKNLEDLKDVAFSADYKSLKNLPEIPPKVRVKGAAETQYRTGDVDITPQNLGLDPTKDMDKPVSTAALEKFDEYYQQLKSYTDKAINDLINGAPTTLDTLKELATAIQNNKSVIDALNSAIGTKANAAEFDTHTKTAASGTVSGHVKVDTALNSTSSNPVQNSVVKNALDKKIDATGNASDTTVTFAAATERKNIVSGEKLSTIFGKILKFFTDLKTVAFSGSYNDLTNKPTIPAAYTLPLASGTTRGGVKTGYAQNNKNYPVQLSNEQMFVSVPWTDTNTDTKVTQNAVTDNASYPLLLGQKSQSTTTTTTACFDSGVTLNPNNNTINANISGAAAKATNDGNGKNIANTYATKDELNSNLNIVPKMFFGILNPNTTLVFPYWSYITKGLILYAWSGNQYYLNAGSIEGTNVFDFCDTPIGNATYFSLQQTASGAFYMKNTNASVAFRYIVICI